MALAKLVITVALSLVRLHAIILLNKIQFLFNRILGTLEFY